MLKRILLLAVAVSLLTAACKKKKKEETTPTTDSNKKSENFISAKIDGTSTTWVDGANNITEGYVSGASLSDCSGQYLYSYFYFGSNFDQEDVAEYTDSPILECDTLYIDCSEELTVETFQSHFFTGQKAYASIDNGTNGYTFNWYDANGEEWSTKFGSQSGSSFNVTKVTYDVNVLNEDIAIIEGTFSCTLYDDNSNSKPVTNGLFKVTMLMDY